MMNAPNLMGLLQVLANRMPDGADYLFLGLVLFGSVIGLALQLLFAILLFRRVGRGAAYHSGVLPISAICVSAVLLVCSLAGLGMGRGLGLVWTQAGWALLLGSCLCILLWAVVALTRTPLSGWPLQGVRWIPVLLALLLPAGFIIPHWLHAASVKARNDHAHRFVEQTFLGHFLGADGLVFSADGKRLISVSEHAKVPRPSVWVLGSTARSHSSSKRQKGGLVASHLCYVEGGLVLFEGRSGFNRGRLLFMDTTAPGANRKELGIEHAGALACTPDGKMAIVGSGLYDGMLSVFRFPEGKIERQWSLSSYARRVAVSDDGRFIAHDSDIPAGIWIRRVSDGVVVRKIVSRLDGSSLRSLAWSAKGDYLALGGNDGYVEVWARVGPGSDKPVMREGTRRNGGAVQVLFSRSSGQLLATGGADFVLARWSPGSWKVTQWLRAWPGGEKGRCRYPDGIHEMTGVEHSPLIVGCHRFADVVDVETGKRLQTLVGLDSGIDAIAFSVASGQVALGGNRQPLTIFRWKDGARIAGDSSTQLTGEAVTLARSGSTGLVAVGMKVGKIALLTGNELRLRSVHFPPAGAIPGDILALVFSADGRAFLSADTHGLLRLWSVEGKYPLVTYRSAVSKSAVALAQLGSNQFLSLSQNGEVRRYKVVKSGLSVGARWHSGCAKGRSLAAYESLDRVAVGCAGGGIKLLSLKTGARVGATKQVHPFGVSALAFAPGGKSLLSGGSDGRVLVWSLPNPRQRRVVFSPRVTKSGKVHGLKKIHRIVFSPNGKKFAVATDSNHDNIHVFSTTALGRD